MSWFKRKKCPLCKSVIKPKHKTWTFEVETAEGVLTFHDVCPKCTYIMEKSHDILSDNGKLMDE